MNKIANETDELIYRLIKKYGSQTRDQLVKRSQIPRSTVYDSISRLRVLNRVWSEPEKNSKRGRPRTLFFIPSFEK